MHEEIHEVSSHMKELGLGILSQSQKNACFGHFDHRLDEGVFSVLQAAHACEIIIKSIISEQHPLLIFSGLPSHRSNESLDIKLLFERGQTLPFHKLPDQLWAVTGYKIEHLDIYENFGRLRNNIQHFSTPKDKDLSQKTIEFIYKVIDPIINYFWGIHAVNYCDIDGNDAKKMEEFFVVLLSRQPEISFPDEYSDLRKKAEIICIELYEDSHL